MIRHTVSQNGMQCLTFRQNVRPHNCVVFLVVGMRTDPSFNRVTGISEPQLRRCPDLNELVGIEADHVACKSRCRTKGARKPRMVELKQGAHTTDIRHRTASHLVHSLRLCVRHFVMPRHHIVRTRTRGTYPLTFCYIARSRTYHVEVGLCQGQAFTSPPKSTSILASLGFLCVVQLAGV